jgi:hypothetical protein
MGSPQDPVLFPLTPESGYYRPTAKRVAKPVPVNLGKMIALTVTAMILCIATGILAGLFIKGLNLQIPKMPWQH